MAILVEDRPQTSAHLDDMHVGDITGGLGTIRRSDTGARRTLRQRLLTFLAIVGPGLPPLRARFATVAARAGRSEAAIMRHGRWKSVQIACRYIRQGARWDDNPAADLAKPAALFLVEHMAPAPIRHSPIGSAASSRMSVTASFSSSGISLTAT
jgi:hypothetical protein